MKIRKYQEIFESMKDMEVLCDQSCADGVRLKYRNANPCASNSSLISRLKSLMSTYPNLTYLVILDDSKYNESDYENRVSFIKEFIGKGNYDIIKYSEMNG